MFYRVSFLLLFPAVILAGTENKPYSDKENKFIEVN